MNLTENQTTEFKREYIDDIKKTVIAFANTAGGRIYIGIADNGEAVGVSDADEVVLKASNAVRDSIRPDVTMFVSYQIDKIDDKDVVVLNIQKGTASPYYLESKGIRPSGVYVRQGASSVPATETAILKMIKDTDGDKYEEIRCTNQNLTFEYAQKEFEHANVEFGDNQKKSLKLINEDGMFTNLAQLLSEQCSHSIKAAVFDGKEKMNFKDRAEFTGSILKQINDAYEYINRYNRTRSEFKDIHRIDIRDYPMEAIREALLNAVVHRDYAFSGSILISIFDDRIEFVSIGGLVKGISYEDMLLGVSIQRNENLANVFYRLNLIEAFGTGIPKIMRCYAEYSQTPEIIVTDNAFKIILPNKSDNNSSSEKAFPMKKKSCVLFRKRSSLTGKKLKICWIFHKQAQQEFLEKWLMKTRLKRSAAERMCHTSNETLKVEIIS